MASLRPQPRPLSLWVMLFVLCLHHCFARKVLVNDLKRENAQPHENVKSVSSESGQVDSNDVSIQGGIGIGCGSHGCPPRGGIPCFQEPCQPYVSIPQPPHIVYPQPIGVPTPSIIVPTPPIGVPTPPICVPTPPIGVPIPCTPCEPWYGPGPCPCEPCEENATDKEGVNVQGHKSNNNAQEGEKLVSSEQPEKEKQEGAPISTQERLSSVAPGIEKPDGAPISTLTLPIIPNQERLSSVPPGKVMTDGAPFIADDPTPASFTSGDG